MDVYGYGRLAALKALRSDGREAITARTGPQQAQTRDLFIECCGSCSHAGVWWSCLIQVYHHGQLRPL